MEIDIKNICPLTGEPTTLTIDYLEVPVLGATNVQYKKCPLYCTAIEDCSKIFNCPVFKTASNTPL